MTEQRTLKDCIEKIDSKLNKKATALSQELAKKATLGEASNFSDLTVNGINYKSFGAYSGTYTDTVTYEDAQVKATEFLYYQANKDGFIGVRCENFYSYWADCDTSGKYRCYLDSPRSAEAKVLEFMVPITKGTRLRLNVMGRNSSGTCKVYFRFIPLITQK